MFSVEDSIIINAPSQQVWQVLLDFEHYQEWNSLLQYLEGQPELGQKLKLRITIPNGISYIFQPTVTQYQENKVFAWKAITGIPGIFDGEHFFELQEIHDRTTKFTNRENFRGLVTPIVKKLSLLRDAEPGFKMMNQELKQRVEQLK